MALTTWATNCTCSSLAQIAFQETGQVNRHIDPDRIPESRWHTPLQATHVVVLEWISERCSVRSVSHVPLALCHRAPVPFILATTLVTRKLSSLASTQQTPARQTDTYQVQRSALVFFVGVGYTCYTQTRSKRHRQTKESSPSRAQALSGGLQDPKDA